MIIKWDGCECKSSEMRIKWSGCECKSSGMKMKRLEWNEVDVSVNPWSESESTWVNEVDVNVSLAEWAWV
jgi:hypothetical protein